MHRTSLQGPGSTSRKNNRVIPPPIELLEPRLLLAGNGLSAVYYNNMDFSGSTVSRIDPQVNFGWGSGSPSSAIAPDTFSARWTGQVQAPASGTYTFYTRTDDGVRLWVNGQLLVNYWIDQGATERSGKITLEAGKRYNIQMDYYENTGDAVARLRWSGPGISKQAIPQAYLYSASVPAPAANLQASPTGSVVLNWIDNATNEQNWIVERSTDGVNYSQLALLPANTTTYTDESTDELVSYVYRVTATNSAGNSAPTTVSITTPLDAPTNLSATAGANVPWIQLQWTDKSLKETNYAISRSTDGVNFTPVAQLPANTTTFKDVGSLAAGTSYQYQVTATTSAASSAPATTAATTANFQVFDAMAFSGQPDLTPIGLQKIYVTDREYLAGSYPNYDTSGPDETATRALADRVVAKGQILVVDEERWMIDLGTTAPATVLANLQKLNQLADWLRSEQPNIRFGFFSILPTRRATGTDSVSVAINAALDALMQKVSDYFPCYYVGATDTPLIWQSRVQTAIANTRAVAAGKPIYPFLWMDEANYAISCPPLPDEFWRLQLQDMRRNADGVVIWGGWQIPQMYQKTWDETAAWWQATSSLAEAAPSAVLPPPSGLSAQSSPGHVQLSWQGVSGAAGYVIERSTDGTNYSTIAVAGPNATTYDDTSVQGVVYSYRLRASSWTEDSPPSQVVTALGARDGLATIQAESANAYVSNNLGFTPTLLVNPANDWIKYSNVDFGAGASRFTARFTDGIALSAQTIELRLDSVSGPVIGVFTPMYTGSMNTFAEQSIAVSGAVGNHDLYLVTHGWGITYMDWMRFDA